LVSVAPRAEQTEYENYYFSMPIPVAARSKVYGRSPAEIVGSNPTVGMDVCLLCVVR